MYNPYVTMKNINIGVFGNLGAGKTSIVQKLQQREGMSSDIAFYSYKVRDSNVTLIDVPGDPSKIQPMLEVASICDAALLAISAEDGVNYQTGEIIIALTLAGIKYGAILVTKTDMVSQDDVENLKNKIRAMFKTTPLGSFPVYEVSTVTNANIPELANALPNLQIGEREQGTFKMPLDHFIEPKSGFTVVTGVVKRGSVKTHDKVNIMPWGKEMVVQSIQIHNEDVEVANAGDRIAIGFKGIHYHDVRRGDVICDSSADMHKSREFTVDFDVNQFYKEPIAKEQRLHLSVGMQFHPVLVRSITKDGNNADAAKGGDKCTLGLESERTSFAIEAGERCILCRPEMPWGTLRICGAGSIKEIK
jgi:selenocysteine-specific elongation factor